MNAKRVKIALMFSDLEMGHDDFGFIARTWSSRRDPDLEDRMYLHFLRKGYPEMWKRNPSVIDGYLFLDEEK